MGWNTNATIISGMGAVAAFMVALPLMGGAGSEPAPSPSPSGPPPAAPTPAPTITTSPNRTTIERAFDTAVAAHEKKRREAGGVRATVFASNGYSTQVGIAGGGRRFQAETGSPTVPEVLGFAKRNYARLAGSELQEAERLIRKAGKPAATWTTETAKLSTVITQWQYPADLPAVAKALSPGLALDGMLPQKDGGTALTGTLNPAKVKDAAARTAFGLPPKAAKPIRVQFNIDSDGILVRLVVDVPGSSTQAIVKQFERVNVQRPAATEVITGKDVRKAMPGGAKDGKRKRGRR